MSTAPKMQRLKTPPLKRLEMAEEWVEQAPDGALASTAKPAKGVATPKAQKAPEAPPKPWEVPAADALHPYTIAIPERLWLKMDHVWKRQGYKSLKEFILSTLTATADAKIKELGGP